MPYCKNCGSHLPDGATFCSQCGTIADNPQGQSNYNNQNSYNSAQYNQPPYEQNQYGANQYPYGQNQYGQPYNNTDSTEGSKFLGVLSYIGLLVIIPFLLVKNSQYERFHTNQGLKLCISSIAYNIVVRIIVGVLRICFSTAVLANFMILSIISAILNLVSILFLVLMIIGIVNAVQGEQKELPLINKIPLLQKLADWLWELKKKI
jgi:uncharacterized Tic20 family protein